MLEHQESICLGFCSPLKTNLTRHLVHCIISKYFNSEKFQIYAKVEGISWRRQWHPTPVFLPEKSHGWRRRLGCSPWGCEESDTTKRLHFHFSLSCVEEGNGNPLQCPCLENPRDGGAWWVTIYGVAQSQTQLKQLSSNSSRGNIFNNYEQFAYSYLLIEFKCHVIKMNQST